jgi:hypothetical protein
MMTYTEILKQVHLKGYDTPVVAAYHSPTTGDWWAARVEVTPALSLLAPQRLLVASRTP